MSYAFVQNMFAIGAVALIATRAITLLSQLQNEDFLTRIVVKECDLGSIYALVANPEDQGRDDVPPNVVDTSYAHVVELTQVQQADLTSIQTCRQDRLHAWHQDKGNQTYWLRAYECSSLPIGYTIRAGNVSASRYKMSYPKIWFTRRPSGSQPFEDNDMRITKLPYLAPPLQPLPGTYAAMNITPYTRKFIVSSGFLDAITGSEPGYRDVNFFLPNDYAVDYPAQSPIPINSMTSIPSICQSGVPSVVACGYVYGPTWPAVNSQVTNRLLDSPDKQYCDVIEDYRSSSPFDILGSIGGLLALLQGIHVFLFGRPIFWGMFGAKLISPFGIVGNFATKGFKQRLREHYGITTSVSGATNGVYINHFLLDYVLDMGPAASHEPESQTQQSTSAPNLNQGR